MISHHNCDYMRCNVTAGGEETFDLQASSLISLKFKISILTKYQF